MKKLFVSVIMIGIFMIMAIPTLAQDQVSIKVIDQFDDPVVGESFVVMFHWQGAGFWTNWTPADDENQAGYYYWNVPDGGGQDVVDQWKVLCPSGITPVSPATQTVTKPIMVTHFRWDVEVP